MEIEKKFLVNKMPDNLSKYTCYEIEQGYLCTSPVVRIRKKNSDYILTYKSREFFKSTPKLAIPDNVSACEEVELPLTKESYEHLREKIDNNIITKRRYNIPLYGDYIAELDVFSGKLEGLIVVEVEFRDALQASIFVKPSWFGDDVSTIKQYGNASLSKLESWN
ncbi:MAG: adenylate cyclase [Clostridiales bacterium]|jgi:CYTH domain-containing protein|nr:adenylate cyclase [Clostridiales bacterium]